MITGVAKKGIYMTEFITALLDPYNNFLRLAFLIGIFASIPFGIVGTYIITRKISYIAGSISHCVLGGIGAALFLRHKFDILWFTPMLGAVISALLAAFIIGIVSIHAKQREDTVIGALWAVGMATGLIFIDLTPGYFDITSYLFGDILLLSNSDLWLVLGLVVFVVTITAIFYNKLLAVCFDDEFACLRGLNTGAYYILLLSLTALTVVFLVRAVGIVMVIALLTLPVAIAGLFTKRLWHMMVLSILLCMVFNCLGLAFSYTHNLSSSPTIIIIAGITYLTAVSSLQIYKKFQNSNF